MIPQRGMSTLQTERCHHLKWWLWNPAHLAKAYFLVDPHPFKVFYGIRSCCIPSIESIMVFSTKGQPWRWDQTGEMICGKDWSGQGAEDEGSAGAGRPASRLYWTGDIWNGKTRLCLDIQWIPLDPKQTFVDSGCPQLLWSSSSAAEKTMIGGGTYWNLGRDLEVMLKWYNQELLGSLAI